MFRMFVFSSVCFLSGATVCACFIFSTLRKRKKRRERKEAIRREAMFTLPDRENTFLRDRLRTRLREDEPSFEVSSDVEFAPVRAMIGRLKAEPLSPAERLGVSDISKRLTALALKNERTAKETEMLNEAFSSLLKLAAKYSVGC